MRIGEMLSLVILGAVVLLTVVMVHERNRENESLLAVIRTEVKAELARQYRNVPRISVEKVYTLQANAQDIVVETVDGGDDR